MSVSCSSLSEQETLPQKGPWGKHCEGGETFDMSVFQRPPGRQEEALNNSDARLPMKDEGPFQGKLQPGLQSTKMCTTQIAIIMVKNFFTLLNSSLKRRKSLLKPDF